ncbi:MAG: hypothetical protein MUE40_21610 [Anaerolineae bacterium]|nr:hypothetical protein [Anaerolineae bacterium]
MVEYALIVVLVILGFGLALASTGPAIANVFSNTVFNLVSRDRLEPGATPPNVVAFWATMTWVPAAHQYPHHPYQYPHQYAAAERHTHPG